MMLERSEVFALFPRLDFLVLRVYFLTLFQQTDYIMIIKDYPIRIRIIIIIMRMYIINYKQTFSFPQPFSTSSFNDFAVTPILICLLTSCILYALIPPLNRARKRLNIIIFTPSNFADVIHSHIAAISWSRGFITTAVVFEWT